MKTMIRTLSWTPLLLGVAAFAQVTPITRVITPVAGYPSLPAYFPGPVSPLGGTILRLPSIKPALLPDVRLPSPAVPAAPRFVAAAAAPAAQMVMTLAYADMPKIRVVADRENAGGRLRRAAPWSHTVNLTGDAQSAAKRPSVLDETFDGRGRRPTPSVVDPYPPLPATSSSRDYTMPEWDLEREIGLDR